MMTKEWWINLVSSVLIAIGAFLVTKGYVTQEQLATFAGGIATLIIGAIAQLWNTTNVTNEVKTLRAYAMKHGMKHK